jgi:hypothetical protein
MSRFPSGHPDDEETEGLSAIPNDAKSETPTSPITSTYYRTYELLKDTPTHKAGWPLRWDGTRRKYYFPKASTFKFDFGTPEPWLDYNGQSFERDEVESKPDWFKPEGKPTAFVPAFPSESKIEEYVYLNFETRLSDDVDVCRALSDLFNDKTFQKEMYHYVKYKYQNFHLEAEDAGNDLSAADPESKVKA